jgi:hypothetical protein
MKFRHQILLGMPVVVLVCGLLPATAEAQFTQQGPKLVATDAVGAQPEQGDSVALSGDGNTAVVGGPGDNLGAGAAWVYTRSGQVWSQQGKLVGTGIVGSLGAKQGSSVALSADGNTAIIGGIEDNDLVGAAWVFTRSAGVWSQQTKLVGAGTVGTALQGNSVALSADGNTAIIGGPNDNLGAGGAWVFTRAGGMWTQQGKLVGTGAIGPTPANQGFSVSLSGDGNTAIVGGQFDNSGVGAAWVYTRSGGVWSQQAKLIGTGIADPANQGHAVSLSGDGNTALVGGITANDEAGATWVFTRAEGMWSQQATLFDPLTVGSAWQGASVSLSDDGNNAIVGGPLDNDDAGAAWVYTRSGGVWSQQGPKLVGTGAVNPAQQGFSVSLSGDGNTAIEGGFDDNRSVGAAWVFAQPPMFAGTPGKANCHGQSVAALARKYGGMNNAAAALGYSDVSALQSAIIAFCED